MQARQRKLSWYNMGFRTKFHCLFHLVSLHCGLILDTVPSRTNLTVGSFRICSGGGQGKASLNLIRFIWLT